MKPEIATVIAGLRALGVCVLAAAWMIVKDDAVDMPSAIATAQASIDSAGFPTA